MWTIKKCERMLARASKNLIREWNGEDVACSASVVHLTTLSGYLSISMTWINL